MDDGLRALDSYARVLGFLTERGQRGRMDLPLIRSVKGVENLLLSMSAVAPATPGAADEEWNPLSQRAHAPLPPKVGNELGAEITALKEAVDAFTTLAHETMHVALWEPFFAGRWKPRRRGVFREFSLLAEGFCFFFGDIVVSGAVRVRLPDGEFALDRHSPSNARFHPVRAFHALEIRDHEKILDIYLDGFNGQQTKLWQPRGTSDFAAALAAQVYEFYVGSQRYLDELHGALTAFGGLGEFYRRFCRIPGLPTFLDEGDGPSGDGEGQLKEYFAGFFQRGVRSLEELTEAQVEAVRWRRMLQMRAYYALQVRWLLSEGLVTAGRGWSAQVRRRLEDGVEEYLGGLRALLLRLARAGSVADGLAALDAEYDAKVRAQFLKCDAWVGHRWLIAPRRAGGSVSVFPREKAAKGREAKVGLLRTVAFVVDELTRRMKDSKTVEDRAAVLALIQRVAALGAAGGGDGADAARTRAAEQKLRAELGRTQLLETWSVPMASFDPVGNAYRELVFSYQ